MKDKLRGLAERWSDRKYDSTDTSHGYSMGLRQARNELLAILDAEGDGGAENKDMELFCCQCFASESSGSWDHVVVGGFCTNCCGNGTTFPLPKAAIESIRQQASWVGKRYYPHAEDLAKAPHPARSGVVSDEDVRDAKRYQWLRKYDNADLLAEDVIDDAINTSSQGERHER